MFSTTQRTRVLTKAVLKDWKVRLAYAGIRAVIALLPLAAAMHHPAFMMVTR